MRAYGLLLCVGSVLGAGWIVPLRGLADEIDTSRLPPVPAGQVDYVGDVQPILQRTCYSCHGAEQQEAGLRLDDKQRALEGGDNGKAILAGQSAKSRLIHLVAGLDPETGRMPPEGEGTPLTPEQIGVLRAWIDQGASWPDGAAGSAGAGKQALWSLAPAKVHPLPAVRDVSWIRNPIDAFVLARLEREKLVPSPPAHPATLLRRLYLDLLGMTPDPGEVAEFLADSRPDAYERLVNRLLASPALGERWGRHWLDLARYADSDGYEKDRPRPFAWRYRHWVIDAINADMPYDAFSVQQLAGDMLADADLDERVAVGFHRNTLHNTEGGTDPEEDRVKKTVDRTNTMGTIWLGLTVGCAQCHSHKYDPLTQREYYQFYAFFNNIDEEDVAAPLRREQEQYERARRAFDSQHAPFLAAIQRYEAEQLSDAQRAWETTALETSAAWQTLELTSAVSRHGASLERQADGSWLARGENRLSDVYSLEASYTGGAVHALRLEVLPDASLPKQGPGRADNGNFVLSELAISLLPDDAAQAPMPLKLGQPQADHAQNNCGVDKAINGNPEDFWAIGPEMGKRHVAVFEVQSPEQLPVAGRLRITLDQRYGQSNPHNLGRFRVSISQSSAPVTLDGMPFDVAQALRIAPAQRTPAQQQAIAEYYRTQDKRLRDLQRSADEHARLAPKPPETKAQSVAQRRELRPTRMLLRGDFLNPGDEVVPAGSSWLPAVSARSKAPDRLDLAQWLVSPDNPLTARVAVNRWWEKIFGRGIVRTVDDFGKQGEAPSHPELLDWLAIELQRSGWSTKELLRLIVTSNAYRQSSAVRTELLAIDPDNALLARQSRRRVEAELIRDLSLTASGLLDPRVGGPSVRPPQPAEYASLTYANSAKWVESQGGDRYRRALYTFFQRTSPYPMLMTFDSPDSNECSARRESSNTPLQALTLWNDPVFFECAQALGRRVIRDVPDSGDAEQTLRERLAYAFTACLARAPDATERAELASLFAFQLVRYQQQPEAAAEVTGKQAPPAGTTVAELAAWTAVGRVLLNLDEFITRE